MLNKLTWLGLVILSFFLFCSNIYQWVDENGIRHYSNTQVPQGLTEQQIKESREIQRKISSQNNAGQKFYVLKVYDGDTILVKGLDLKFKIRLAGIDAPESKYKKRPSQPFSQSATQYLTHLVEHKYITLKSHGMGGYNRQLAEIFINGKNINLEMVTKGLAEVYKGRLPKSLAKELYFEQERAARQGRIGIWSQGDAYQSPKRWRKVHPVK